MKLTVKKQIGKNSYAFSFEGKDLHEVLMESKKLSFWDLDKCGLCGSDFIELDAYKTKDKGFKYTTVRCRKCKGKLTLGQKQEDGAVYYRKSDDGKLDWQKFDGKPETEEIQWKD